MARIPLAAAVLLCAASLGGAVAPLAAAPVWSVGGASYGDSLGHCVASAGDVNGDGYDDVLVSAFQFNSGSGQVGAVFIYYGSPTGLVEPPPAQTRSLEGTDVGARFGWSVSGAGDVNGDGFDDVIIGVDRQGLLDTGAAYVHFGSAAGLSAAPDWSFVEALTLASFGSAVAGAGDLNGDGYDDLIVGSCGYANPDWREGRACAFYGGAGGPSLSPDWSVESDSDSAVFGIGVAGAGDVNGDGFDDVIIGAQGFAGAGKAFVYHGGPSGLSPSSTIANADWSCLGAQAGSYFGRSVNGAGDVDNDGYDDVIVGAMTWDGGHMDEGRVFLFRGGAGGLETEASWTAEGDQTEAWFGFSAGGAGDLNGDGFGDVVVGARWYDGAQANDGRAWAYYGSSDGLSPTAAWSAGGDQADSEFGISVAGAGDVNGDGFGDLIVGAELFSVESVGSREGAAFVYHYVPLSVSALQQFTAGGTSSIPSGTTILETGFTARATGSDPLAQGAMQLEVEVKPAGTAFSGSVSATSAPFPAGQVGSATITGLARDTEYHWQCRVRNQSTGELSAWRSFGTNPDDEDEVDFRVRANTPPAVAWVDQQEAASGLPVPVGAEVAGGAVRLTSLATDDDNDDVMIEVEVQPVGTALGGPATSVGGPVAPGSVAAVVVAPAPGGYHWRFRVRDAAGDATPWTSFGGNPEAAPDFQMLAVPVLGGSTNDSPNCLQAAGAPSGCGLTSAALRILAFWRR